MKRHLLASFIGLGVVVGLIGGGCAVIQGTSRSNLFKTPEIEGAFHKAEKVFYAERFPEAKQAYLSFLEDFPANIFTAKTHFRLGEIALSEGDLKGAVSHYQKSLSRGIDPHWGTLAIYKEAVACSRLKELKKVLSLLDRIPLDSTDSKVKARAGSLRISTAKQLNDPLEEKKGYLDLIDAYEGLNPDDIHVGDLNWIVSEKTAREEIQQWIETDGGDDASSLGSLKSWNRRFKGTTSGGYVTWKLAKISHQKGDYSNAASWAREYLDLYSKGEYAAAARSLLLETDKRGETTQEEKRGLIGVLLPLSGKYAVYGESVLHGLECAAGIFAPCRGDLGVNLLIRDTRGDPAVAAQIIDEFAHNPEVRTVIGPLPQIEVATAAAAAETASLPMITLSQKVDVAKIGPFIFRNFLTVADQVATVVDYACNEKKRKKFAILAPAGETGEEYKREFESEVDRCGGKVVASASYPPETYDFAEAVRDLKLSSREQSAAAVPFQTLFIPDLYRKIPYVVSALKSSGIEGITLLGGAGWDHPGLLKGGGEGLEGVIFVDGFFAKGSEHATQDFVSTFLAAYGFEPTLLEAYAYDTLRLLGEVLRDHPNLSRPDLQKEIAQKRDFPGVTGRISFDEDGDARRRLILLTVEAGEIREVQ